MNVLRVVNTILRSPNRYAGSFSRVMVSIHPDELCSLKESIELLEQGLHKTTRQINILEVQMNNLQNKNNYHIIPKLQKLTEKMKHNSSET